MAVSTKSIDERITRLQSQGVIDLHFDLPMDLFEKRDRPDVLVTEFLPELEAGHIGVLAAAIYIEDRYIAAGKTLSVALGQIARVYTESERSNRISVCKSYREILEAREAGKIALLLAMEGVEPLGTDVDLLRVFYELGVRVIGLTHARPNAAANGGVFAPRGSSPDGLSAFGREIVSRCDALGIVLDLAHINPAGFQDVLSMATKPVIVSHTNARRYYDIERNISDEQIRMIGKKGGVIGVNSVLVSPEKEQSTLDHYVDHIKHFVDLIGIEGVGIGFDFFEFIYRQWTEAARRELAAKLTEPHFIPDLRNHSHAPNLIRKLIERGFSDEQIEKILFGNWMRIFEELL
jgi:membrane dipeptidase